MKKSNTKEGVIQELVENEPAHAGCVLKRFISSILSHPGNPFFFSFLALGFITGFTNEGLVCGASIAAMFLVTVGPIYLFGAWIGRNDA